jgi:plasmid replication initiation protein
MLYKNPSQTCYSNALRYALKLIIKIKLYLKEKIRPKFVIVGGESMSESNIIFKKSNSLIQAKYDYSYAEQRLVLYIISKVRNDSDLTLRIRTKDFYDVCGIKSHNYDELKNVTLQLKQKVLVIKFEIEGRKKELQTSWVNDVIYDDKGYIEIDISKNLKPYLMDLQKFYTELNLKYCFRLKSLYSARLYEILKQWENRGEVEFKLSYFRDLLSIKDHEYPMYANLKQRVIITAQKELEKHTDIYFEYEEVKADRKVTALKIKIFKNEKNIDSETAITIETQPVKRHKPKNGFDNFTERVYDSKALEEAWLKKSSERLNDL